MICGETPYFNLDKENKVSTLFHGTAAQSFCSLMHAMGFNMTTYPYYESGERVLKPWIRDLSEGAGNGLLFDYVEEHEAGIFQRTEQMLSTGLNQTTMIVSMR